MSAATTMRALVLRQHGGLDKLEVVKGSWGTGRLLAGNAFSVVLTDDGRVAFGAVKPENLYQALR